MPSVNSQTGRIGGLTRSSRHWGDEVTARARQVFQESFEDQVDPRRELPERERLRRAEAARKAHYARLAYRAAKAKAAKREKTRASKAFTPSTLGEEVSSDDHLQSTG